MNITLVKKIKANGNPCRRSADVLCDLEELGLMEQIDQVIAADERKPFSEGLNLALTYNVEAAPFFIVKNEDGSTRVYTTYYRFLKEIFNHEISKSEEAVEILAQNPELDFI